ncbi:MAG: transcriptional repressor NrdR [Clostridia bacterium]|nr:transcriptional repressor NrdR [Clostridia bacterium]
MKCFYCGCKDSRVVDSRMTEDGIVIRRRRECEQCKKRFTTYEKIEFAPMYVIKNDNRREEFSAEKVRNSIMKACAKRPVPIAKVDQLVLSVEQEVNNSYSQEVPSKKIGELVMNGLKSIDEVAYVRYASVYRQFRDINSFMDELRSLLDEDSIQ